MQNNLKELEIEIELGFANVVGVLARLAHENQELEIILNNILSLAVKYDRYIVSLKKSLGEESKVVQDITKIT